MQIYPIMKGFKCWISLCKSSPYHKELMKSTHFGYNNLIIPDLHFCISEDKKSSVEKKIKFHQF